jgi:anti-sigma regulatory factor (Ser/Thr protein kinase)
MSGGMGASAPGFSAGLFPAANGGAGAGGPRGVFPWLSWEPAAVPAPPMVFDVLALRETWPLADFQQYSPSRSAVRSARLHTRLITGEWGLAHVGELAERVVGELVANAVTASTVLPSPGPVRIWLLSDRRGAIMILVADISSQAPQVGDPGPDDEHGRGLMVVRALCEHFGWYLLPEGTGKVASALVRVGS